KIEEHRAGIEPALPRYECGVVAARPPVLAVSVGPDGLEPSPAWVRTRYAAANTLIPSLSRSPSIGTEGIEPSPCRLKGGCAAVTPRPQVFVGPHAFEQL